MRLLCKQSIKTKHMYFILYIAMHTARFHFEIAFWCMLIDGWWGCLYVDVIAITKHDWVYLQNAYRAGLRTLLFDYLKQKKKE